MIRLTESTIKSLAKKIVKEAVDKLNVRSGGIDRDTIMNGVTLYHRPKDATVTVGGEQLSIIDSLFKYGFSREFTGSNGGNLYGAGVYSVYNLKSSTNNATSYGRNIIMLKLLGGYQDFLIGSIQLAKEVYGQGWKFTDQLRYLYPDVADDIISQVGEFAMNNDDDPTNPIVLDRNGNEVDNSDGRFKRSADTMYKITSILRTNANNGKCRGWVYNGNHDGDCCVIMDFSSVVPVAVSSDNGQTWDEKINDNLIARFNTEVDTHFQLGSNFKDVADKSINGYTMVWNDEDKVNYVQASSNEPISDVWFDDGMNWDNKNGILFAEVQYQGYELYLVYEDGEYQVYSTDWEPQCSLEELPSLI